MGEFGKGIKSFKQNVNDGEKPVQDASMSQPAPNPGTLNAPLQDSIKPKSSVNQG
jgi:Sec-independent protein translocase protein TatA